MIIVYYDSAVQTAFEELVKFVSGSRNAMRKGKMAAKMAEMRRAAELEVEGDDDNDESEPGDLVPSYGTLLGSQNSAPRVAGIPRVAGPKGELEADTEMPKLRFVSTRQMGPPRDHTKPSDNAGAALSLGMLKNYKRGRDTGVDVFDTLDKGLEWCQSQCEHAAHQFLRDGTCTTEIENIKGKLGEVKETAEKEIQRLRQDQASTSGNPSRRATQEEVKSRERKSIQMRNADPGALRDLEVDGAVAMEVDDDEGVDDLEPPTLIFRRTRDIAR